MARTPKLPANKRIDQWTLKEWLGGGGNGEVWRAISDGDPVALKVLVSQYRDRESEPYKRFQNEIDAMQRLRGHDGVLPLLSHWDAETGSRPWLSTPIAVPLRESLEDAEVSRIVEAVAAVAHTLSRISAQHGMYHRDIKPDNLFRFGTQWCIGDFGLVTFPEAQFNTIEGAKLGPLYFIAPEMLNPKILDHDSHDAGPADVFSLAKTLWVIIADQNYPLPGQMRRDEPMCQLSTYRKEHNLRGLETLIEASTRFNPADRPTMREFACQLDAWRHPTEPCAPPLSLDEVRRRFGPTFQSHAEREAAMRHLRDHVQGTINSLTPTFEQLAGAFTRATTIVPEREFAGFAGFNDVPALKELEDRTRFFYSTHRTMIAYAIRARPGDANIDAVAWYSGIAIGTDLSGNLKIKAAHVMRDGPTSRTLWIGERTARAETPLETGSLTELMNDLLGSLASTIPELEEAVDS